MTATKKKTARNTPLRDWLHTNNARRLWDAKPEVGRGQTPAFRLEAWTVKGNIIIIQHFQEQDESGKIIDEDWESYIMASDSNNINQTLRAMEVRFGIPTPAQLETAEGRAE